MCVEKIEIVLDGFVKTAIVAIDVKNKVEFYQKQLLEIISENYKNYKT